MIHGTRGSYSKINDKNNIKTRPIFINNWSFNDDGIKRDETKIAFSELQNN